MKQRRLASIFMTSDKHTVGDQFLEAFTAFAMATGSGRGVPEAYHTTAMTA
jgi:hypothetical protein